MSVLNQRHTLKRRIRSGCSDTTYLWTAEGWLCACCVLDLFTRKIVGWSLEPHMSHEMVLQAMTMAYQDRRRELSTSTHSLIFHSDRGSQYASQDVRSWLAQRGMKQSMSGTGNCYVREAWPRATMRQWKASGIR